MIEYVCPIGASLYEEVLDHLRCTFFWEEPLNVCVGLCATQGSGHAKLEAVCVDTMDDGISVAALSGGRVVGVALNGSQTRQQLEQCVQDTEQETDPKFRSIFSMLYGTNLALGLHAKYGADRIFECRILSVDPEFRGRGIARALLERSEREARDRGFRLFKVDATSHFSQRLTRALGLHVETELRYCEHVDEAGQPVFQPPPPHTSLLVVSRKI